MHSSLSFNSNNDKNTVKKTNFQKDIIIPFIYSNENYEFIKNNSYPTQPERKVLKAKQSKVQSIVQTIVMKKNMEVSKKKAHYAHRLSKPIFKNPRKSLPSYISNKPNNFVMDIDQKINELAITFTQQTSIAKQRLKQTMDKVNEVVSSQQNKLQTEQINFYLTELSPKKKSKQVPPHQIHIITSYPAKKNYKGYVEQHEQRQRARELRNKKQINTQTQMKVKIIKNRPKTAQTKTYRTNNANQFFTNQTQTLFRSNSLMNTRLSRFEQARQVRQNIKAKGKNEAEKQKMRKLFDQIESNSLQNTLNKTQFVRQMNKLGMVWKTEKEFLQNQPTRSVMHISNETLQVLISRRKKQYQMNQLDEKFIASSQSESQPPQY